MPTYSGIRSTDQAPASSRYRASWARGWFARNSWFPPSALEAVYAVQDNGPARGFFVVSSPAVSPGDDSIVLDVKTQTSWRGTAAALATALDAVIGNGFQLEGLKFVPAGESSKAAAADREKVQATTETKADARTVGAAAGAVVRGVRSTVYMAAAAALLLVLLVYAPQLKAAGRAVKRAARTVGK